jgi:hypothetical protein
MSTVALEKVVSNVAEGVTPHCVAQLVLESRDRLPKLGVPDLIYPCLLIPFNYQMSS